MKKMIFVIPGLLIFACKNNTSVKPPNETHDFFPVTAFIMGQVHEIDSLKLPVHKYSTVNNTTDSVLISPGAFDTLASEFTEQDINDPLTKKFYQETSFADQSIPSVTFTYSTHNNDLTLQRTDVVISPDPILNDKVKSIYLEKVSKNGDTLVVKKLYWKTGNSFEIISSKKIPASFELITIVKVSWD